MIGSCTSRCLLRDILSAWMLYPLRATNLKERVISMLRKNRMPKNRPSTADQSRDTGRYTSIGVYESNNDA